MNKILYIYGYGSDPKQSSTMKVMRSVMKELGYELVSVEYNQNEPDTGFEQLESFIRKNNIKYVIGHSLGGFFALCLISDVKTIVINPCLKPVDELGKLGFNAPDKYIRIQKWMYSGLDQPWCYQIQDVLGIFSDNDELFSYRNDFASLYGSGKTIVIQAGHRPPKDAFTDEIKTRIKKILS